MPRGKNNDGLPNPGWFKTGDPKLKIKTPEHRAAISASQRIAWQTKRQRMPIGAKWKDAGGYIRVKISEGKGKWKLEHVMVMEEVIGRSVRKGEIVHHVDGQRDSNGESNLYLCKSHADHMRVERSLVAAFREMLKAGKVRFNRELGTYEPLL